MATLDNTIRAEEVLGFTRSTYQKLSEQYQLTRLFPNEDLNRNKFRIVVDQRTAVAAAKFRPFDVEGYNVGRQGVGYKEQEIAPMTVTMPLSEQETLNKLAFDTRDFGPMIEQLYDDLGTLTEMIVTTFELLRAQLLSDARCTVKFLDGSTAVVDYGLRSDHRVVASTLWSNTSSSNPLANIRLWKSVYRANRRRDPEVAYVTQTVVDYLLLNDSVRSLLASLVGSPSILTVEQLNLVLRAHGLPTLIVIDELLVDYDGATTTALPNNLFVMAPAGELGKTFHGVTPAALGMADDNVINSQLAPGIVGQVWKNHNPYGRYSLAEAIGLPSIGNVDDLFIAQVA